MKSLQERHRLDPQVRELLGGGVLILQPQSSPQMMLEPSLQIFQLDPKHQGEDISHSLGLNF